MYVCMPHVKVELMNCILLACSVLPSYEAFMHGSYLACYLLERFSFECRKVIGFAFAFGFHAT